MIWVMFHSPAFLRFRWFNISFIFAAASSWYNKCELKQSEKKCSSFPLEISGWISGLLSVGVFAGNDTQRIT